MNKTEREAVADFLEWFADVALEYIPKEVFQKRGQVLRHKLEGVVLDYSEESIYLVVCANGFARGTFLPRDMESLENCARVRNALCTCGGQHRIVRAVQQGTGRDIT